MQLIQDMVLLDPKQRLTFEKLVSFEKTALDITVKYTDVGNNLTNDSKRERSNSFRIKTKNRNNSVPLSKTLNLRLAPHTPINALNMRFFFKTRPQNIKTLTPMVARGGYDLRKIY